MTITRRTLLRGATLGFALGTSAAFGRDDPFVGTSSNELLPFAKGDVLVGCTLLNDPADDHRGRGRILHYDSTLQFRQTLWLDDTTHIVQGLSFAPNGMLWVFDAFAHKVIWLKPNGQRAPCPSFPQRAFAHINFAADGRYFLGENFVGERSRVPLKTTLPFVPGTQRFGDGYLYEFSPQHELMHIHATPVHGGMGGFQGLTSSTLVNQDRTLIYTSESGPRIMRWDLQKRRALPDLVRHADDSGRMFFEIRLESAGTILVLTGLTIEQYTQDGLLQRVYPLGSFGWASMSRPREKRVYLSNFFSGEIACLDLVTGAIIARAQTGIRKSASGLDQYLFS